MRRREFLRDREAAYVGFSLGFLLQLLTTTAPRYGVSKREDSFRCLGLLRRHKVCG
jgi:hypothetical protein